MQIQPVFEVTMLNATLTEQRKDWDTWNLEYRGSDQPDSFMLRQVQVAGAVAARLTLERQNSAIKILDFGCGTGWLANVLSRFGHATGIDISKAAIDHGLSKYSQNYMLYLLCGGLELIGGTYDLIVSADSLAHVEDQRACLKMLGNMLSPGGILLLMTQNPFVWKRKKNVMPTQNRLRKWVGVKEIQAMLPEGLVIERTSSIDPGGNKGILRLVESRKARAFADYLIGIDRWEGLLEAAGLGRELVVICRKVA